MTTLWLVLLACLHYLAAARQFTSKSNSQSRPTALESLAFPVQQPFGSLQLTKAGCCPYASYPVPPKDMDPPNLAVVIGAQKAATTLLFQMLVLHPQVVVTPPPASDLDDVMKLFRTKEKHFFNSNPKRMSEQHLLEYIQAYKGVSEKKDSVWLDATPDYAQTPWAACRMRAAVPHAKLILLLRDPVARTFSHWRMINDKALWKGKAFLLRGRPLDPFPQAIDEELEWLRGKGCTFMDPKNKTSWNDCFQCHTNFCRDYNSTHNIHDNFCEFNAAGNAGIIANSMYAPQLAWWLSFFPPEQLLVLSSEYFLDHQDEVMSQIFEFMGLKPITLTPEQVSEKEQEISRHTEHAKLDEYDPNNHVDKLNELYKWFEPLNNQLYSLLESMGVKNFQKFPTEYVKTSSSDHHRRRMW